jgi:FtsP/CotA-like multicopper oxidase with cupredoxin domain
MYILGRAASGVAPIPGSPPGPPTADNGLINGTNVNSAGGGHFANVALIPGKKYRLRLVNTAVDNHFQVSLDQHTFTVIQSDFVPIVPYDTTWLFVGIGERYDVVFTASQKPANYWFRAEVQAGCGNNAMSGNIKAIFNYKGVVLGNPTSKPAVNFTNSCEDEKSLVPYVAKDVPEREFRKNYAAESLRETLTVDLSITPGNTFFWNINK